MHIHTDMYIKFTIWIKQQLGLVFKSYFIGKWIIIISMLLNRKKTTIDICAQKFYSYSLYKDPAGYYLHK